MWTGNANRVRARGHISKDRLWVELSGVHESYAALVDAALSSLPPASAGPGPSPPPQRSPAPGSPAPSSGWAKPDGAARAPIGSATGIRTILPER